MRNRSKSRTIIKLYYGWMTAAKTTMCTGSPCHNIVTKGERVIGIIQQHDHERLEEPKYWCVACSPEKCKRLLDSGA